MKRFRGLTEAQERALSLIAIDQRPNASHSTLQALKDAGLVIERQRRIGSDGFGPIIVPEYEMPPAVHIEWCQWCSAHPPKGGWESYG